jgi:hypothetical protein
MTSGFNASSVFGISFHVRVFMIVVESMQCDRRSYSDARTCKSRCGLRSWTICWAICSMRASQSGGGMCVVSVIFSLLLVSRDAVQCERTEESYFCA